ncbi:MAG TPA: tetratricopeptide repeat protein [bacterium]
MVALVLAASGTPARSEDWEAVTDELERELRRSAGREDVRRQLAVAYNNLGVERADASRWEEAEQAFEQAIELLPEDRQFQLNLSQVSLRHAAALLHEIDPRRRTQGDVRRVRTLIDRAVELTPDLADAHLFLGDVAYREQRLEDAERAWSRAAELAPDREDIRARLDRVGGELPVESDFDRLTGAYFEIRYEEGLQRGVGFDVRESLLDARREVGGDFRYWPKQKMIVLVYDSETFRAMRAGTPEWVAAQYDGKIRLPLPGDSLGVNDVRRILYHEYTHALVQDLARGRCPVWLNEGLAEHQAARVMEPPRALLGAAMAQERLIPWAELERRLTGARTGEEAALAYQQAHSVVSYLAGRFGFWRMRRLLERLADGADIEDALRQELHSSPERLERAWRAWLPSFLG